ncbi:LexA family protein [Rhodohalobacter barkolensis]|uniref:LexA family protein n=1 Tax=Rhodohalobacter barkolensis TaxID=2053187 RepID=UPI000D5268E9|nr:translesion error-prone DNA polymerase V autoproteolytic subunit [Rhodohalobacter barkolensis]
MKAAIAYPGNTVTEPQSSGVNETGFPSPATDHLENRLNLHKHVVKHPTSTFFSRVEGESNSLLGIHNGDILVVDRSLAPKNDSLVLAVLDGEITICRVERQFDEWVLLLGDGSHRPISFGDETVIWGKVTHIVHAV